MRALKRSRLFSKTFRFFPRLMSSWQIFMNRLVHEKSAYLKHAANQKIEWYSWSEEAFERAGRENKPVFLSTGAVWCHWCHVMAKESFEDEETVRLLNELFINIKLDRDERPDIDRRYQQAVAAMGSGSGWPLSVFLMPDKKPFYGGTYFPPQDMQGRPAFRKVLAAVSDFYKNKHADAAAFSRKVMDTLKTEALDPSPISENLIDEAERSLLSQIDREHGGFGTAPKFPMPGALEFLLRRSRVEDDPAAAKAARRMLDAMARGGFHDHLGGGFHRYSTDASWTVPHFEKMADDNAGLLRNYTDAFAVFGDARYREIARDIIAFTREVLSDPGGGFYASQDADVTPDDEGGYFTWTDEDLRSALGPEEYEVLSAYLLHEKGSMHHDPAKKVVFEKRPLEEIAKSTGKGIDDVRRIVARGKGKLLTTRSRRVTPFIDRTLYTSLNGMLIAAYFHAFNVLGDENSKAFGVKSLERILGERFIDHELMHAEGISAGLDDYIHFIDALVAGYEATAAQRYLLLADELMAICINKFYDPGAGGFFDTEHEVLGTRLKKIEDAPHPSANALGILLLLKLSLMTGKEEYRMYGEQSLSLFSGFAHEIGAHAGAYFCSLDASFRLLKLAVEAAPESELAATARALTGKVYAAIVYGDDHGRVIPCSQNTCSTPIQEPEDLRVLS
jgi:uncharacterized protein